MDWKHSVVHLAIIFTVTTTGMDLIARETRGFAAFGAETAIVQMYLYTAAKDTLISVSFNKSNFPVSHIASPKFKRNRSKFQPNLNLWQQKNVSSLSRYSCFRLDKEAKIWRSI